jgi:hypothetical protein
MTTKITAMISMVVNIIKTSKRRKKEDGGWKKSNILPSSLLSLPS